MLHKTVYVLPAQVVYPFVTLSEHLSMSAAGYQWLTDIIKNYHYYILYLTSYCGCLDVINFLLVNKVQSQHF